MTGLDEYRSRFTGSGLRVLNQAIDESTGREQNYLSLSHLFNALKVEEPSLYNQIFSFLKTEPPLTDEFLETLLARAPRHQGQGIYISPDTTWLFRHALKFARATNRQRIEARDLVFGLLDGLITNSHWLTQKTDRSIGLSYKTVNRHYFCLMDL